MTYLWVNGLPIRVQTDSIGQPQHLVWNGQKHTIRSILNRWVFQDRWWSEDEHLWRDYYFLTTHSGLMLIVFQNVVSGSWFIYRLYD